MSSSSPAAKSASVCSIRSGSSLTCLPSSVTGRGSKSGRGLSLTRPIFTSSKKTSPRAIPSRSMPSTTKPRLLYIQIARSLWETTESPMRCIASCPWR